VDEIYDHDTPHVVFESRPTVEVSINLLYVAIVQPLLSKASVLTFLTGLSTHV